MNILDPYCKMPQKMIFKIIQLTTLFKWGVMFLFLLIFIAMHGIPLFKPAIVAANTDDQLTLQGYFIAQGGFLLKRSLKNSALCPSGNLSCAAEKFEERPEFLANVNSLPDAIKQIIVVPQYSWQEVIPSSP